jgi:hypothetical protein
MKTFIEIRYKIRDVIGMVKIGTQLLGYRFLSLFTHRFDENIKQLKIAYILCTSEGRELLARAMVEPIRRSLDYQGLGRKLLIVDELPQGAYARYERAVINEADDLLQRQMALNPNLVVMTATEQNQWIDNMSGSNASSFSRDIAVYAPYYPLYVSNAMSIKEDLLNEKKLKERKEQVKSAITEIQIGG